MINLLSGIAASSSALDAERTRMEVISQNIANVQTLRSTDGRPYQRQQVVFENVLKQQAGMDGGGPYEVAVSQIVKDHKPFKMAYNPKHPMADSKGFVAYPNIDINDEMVDMIAATRTYEANLAVVRSARAMAMQTLSIGKR